MERVDWRVSQLSEERVTREYLPANRVYAVMRRLTAEPQIDGESFAVELRFVRPLRAAIKVLFIQRLTQFEDKLGQSLRVLLASDFRRDGRAGELGALPVVLAIAFANGLL